MIKRYQNSEIEQIWNKENQIHIWLKIEKLVIDYWYHQGVLSQKTKDEMEKLKCNINELEKIEKITKHEISAFVKMLSNQIKDKKHAKWIHYGLTSNDILDTSQNFLLKKSYFLIIEKIETILEALKEKANKEKYTTSVGRTHGMHAEPVTIGFKFALWFNELKNHLRRIKAAGQEINYVKILGPTGVSAHFSLDLNQFVAEKLNMKATTIATQVISRDGLIHFFNTLTNLVTSIEKMAIEIRNLSRSEINEMQEGFSDKQDGSSAMPHKKNPILSENICGLIRYLRATNNSFYNTNLLWHERDLTNSSIERLAIPNSLHLTMTILNRFEHILKTLQINHQQIKINLEKAQNIMFSHSLLLTLIAKTNLDRQEAYKLIQKISFNKNETKKEWERLIVQEKKHLTKIEFEKCFTLKKFEKQIDNIFQKVFKKDE